MVTVRFRSDFSGRLVVNQMFPLVEVYFIAE